MEQIDMTMVGILVICLAAFITFLLQSTVALMTVFDRLWPKPVPVGLDALVKASDLSGAVREIKLMIDTLASRETVTALSTRMLALEQTTDRSEKYAHESIHRINNTLQAVVNRVDVMGIKLDTHLGYCGPVSKGPINEEG